MPKLSAGILPYRIVDGVIEVFVVHPGGPFWAKKDSGAWSITKGEYEDSEDALSTAKREFAEETGTPLPDGELHALGELKQPSGKRITAWAIEAKRLSAENVSSNTFSMEWPKGSGVEQEFPEIDKAAWFTISKAREKLLKGQLEYLDRLLAYLRTSTDVTLSEGEPDIPDQVTLFE